MKAFSAPLIIVLTSLTSLSALALETPDFDLLDLPLGTQMTLDRELSFEESVSSQLRAVTFQNGRILKKKERANPKKTKCDVAALVPNTEKMAAGLLIYLCDREFMQLGNGKVYLDFRVDSECGERSPGAAVICESENPDRDLMFSDLTTALGDGFSFSKP